MKTKVFELRQGSILHIGTVKGIVKSPGIIWHLTNHGCWNKAKRIISENCRYFPTENDKGCTNSNIFFTYKEYTYFALPCGFAIIPKSQLSTALLFYNKAQNTYDFHKLEDLSIK